MKSSLQDRLELGEVRRPHHRGGRPAQVLERHLAHAGQAVAALFDVLDLQADDHPAEGDLGLLADGPEVGDLMGREGLKHLGVSGQRVARHVEAERLLLVGQTLDLGVFLDVGQGDGERGGLGRRAVAADVSNMSNMCPCCES